MSKFGCNAIENATDLITEQGSSDEFYASNDIFDISRAIGHPDVLEVPLHAERISNELIQVSVTKGVFTLNYKMIP